MDAPPEVAIEIERKKLAIEERRLANEERQARGWKSYVALFGTPLAIVASIAVSAFTITNQISENNKQAKLEISENNKQAKVDFELAAAEIAMNTDSPTGTRNRANAMKALFPKRLPETFGVKFDPSKYEAQNSTGSEVEGERRALENAVLEHPAEAEQLVRAWIAFHPEDETWATDILERMR